MKFDFIDVPLKPCPWCGKTPTIDLSMFDEVSWVWSIACGNCQCSFQPHGMHVTVRKKQKLNQSIMIDKIQTLCKSWNGYNSFGNNTVEYIRISFSSWYKFIEKQKNE
jgi:hypothetical protein